MCCTKMGHTNQLTVWNNILFQEIRIGIKRLDQVVIHLHDTLT